MWRRFLILNIREMVSFRGRCRNKNANSVRTAFQMWCGLLRLAKRWSPHIGRWWGFLQGLLYQRWRLLQDIKGHKSKRLRILLYLQTKKGTYLSSALLWHGLNAISKSFCTAKGFKSRFIGTCTLMYNRDLMNFTWSTFMISVKHKTTFGRRIFIFQVRVLPRSWAGGCQ